jgi:DNA-binding PadR family transcriptional regulator
MDDAVLEHLPVSPIVLEILIALGGPPLHGYAVAQAIRSRTDGRIRLQTGPLYRHLKRLLDQGLVEEAPDGTGRDDPRRSAYYRLTWLGRQVVAAESRRLADLVRFARRAGLAGETRS